VPPQEFPPGPVTPPPLAAGPAPEPLPAGPPNCLQPPPSAAGCAPTPPPLRAAPSPAASPPPREPLLERLPRSEEARRRRNRLRHQREVRRRNNAREFLRQQERRLRQQDAAAPVAGPPGPGEDRRRAGRGASRLCGWLAPKRRRPTQGGGWCRHIGGRRPQPAQRCRHGRPAGAVTR